MKLADTARDRTGQLPVGSIEARVDRLISRQVIPPEGRTQVTNKLTAALGAYLGHEAGDSKGQQRYPADSCAPALTSGDGSEQRRTPGHTVHGMQGIGQESLRVGAEGSACSVNGPNRDTTVELLTSSYSMTSMVPWICRSRVGPSQPCGGSDFQRLGGGLGDEGDRRIPTVKAEPTAPRCATPSSPGRATGVPFTAVATVPGRTLHG
jgi:hypothetical protein